jgi:translation initiation factor IF-3
VVRFLKQGDKVKITIMFRGREQSRPELGFRLLQRLAGDVAELGFVESAPKQDGRNMIMVLGPVKKKSEARAERAADKARRGTSEDPGSETGAPASALADLPDDTDQTDQTDQPDQPAPPAPVETPSAAQQTA